MVKWSEDVRRVAVQDANIFIDLELAGLLDLWLQVGLEIHTTDFIAAQLRRGGHRIALAQIDSGEIVCHALSFEQLLEVTQLRARVGEGPDLADCSVLWLSETLGCMLLTGDAPLRRACVDRVVEVHGTLWIIDLLVGQRLLRGMAAVARLEFLRSLGRRLPEKECEALMEKWRGKS
jgi:hypothetical protein